MDPGSELDEDIGARPVHGLAERERGGIGPQPEGPADRIPGLPLAQVGGVVVVVVSQMALAPLRSCWGKK